MYRGIIISSNRNENFSFSSPESLELASLEPEVGVCSQGQVAGGVGGLLEPEVWVSGGGLVADG